MRKLEKELHSAIALMLNGNKQGLQEITFKAPLVILLLTYFYKMFGITPFFRLKDQQVYTIFSLPVL
jgi:hypothetical protein